MVEENMALRYDLLYISKKYESLLRVTIPLVLRDLTLDSELSNPGVAARRSILTPQCSRLHFPQDCAKPKG
jgi:hypothetical protein